MTTLSRVMLALALGVPALAMARVEVLTVGTFARFEHRGNPERSGGVVRAGRDRALRVPHDPSCPAPSRVDILSKLEASARQVLVGADLDCTKWTAHGGGWRYRDRAGVVRTIRYTRSGLRITVGGPDFGPLQGPATVLQTQLTIGDTQLRTRFQNFTADDVGRVVTRRPSADAATGEAAFWDVIWGDDTSEGRQQAAIAALERAAKRSRRDARSRFLLGVFQAYRFGRLAPNPAAPSPEALAAVRASAEWLEEAARLLWDGTRGDSRIPGFAAAMRYYLGAATSDAELRTRALAEIDEAFRANPLFNGFDYAVVLDIAPRTSADFARAFAVFDAYVSTVDPSCFFTLPEQCSNEGMARSNFPASPLVFGDLYAKAGDLGSAQRWYAIARAFNRPDYRFTDVLAERQRNAAQRVALYLDDDPTNDPTTIMTGPTTCGFCHNR
jgi:hypothetical protein